MDPIKPSDPRLPPTPCPDPPFPTEPPAPDTPLVDLVPWWLSVRCACGGHTYLPFRWLSAVHGWQTPLSAVLARLKCDSCGARAEDVELVADPAARKGEAGYRVVRVG